MAKKPKNSWKDPTRYTGHPTQKLGTQEITLKRLHRTQLDYLESSKTPSRTYINKTVLVKDLITFHKQSGEFSQARQAVVFIVGCWDYIH